MTVATGRAGRWPLALAGGLALAAAMAGPAARAGQPVPNPATAAGDRSRRSDEDGPSEGEPDADPDAPDEHFRSWQAPRRLDAAASPPAEGRRLREEDRIGDYGQPRWTAHRRFPTTRIYVRPKGMMDFEWWLESKLNLKDTSDVRHRSLYEVELGLGHRLQLDLYLATQQKGHDGPWTLHQEKVELRWALANWGVLWGNPTLYVELAREHEAPPKVELKLLLGDELGPGWHWGANVVFEHRLGGDQEHEYALTGAVAHTLVDETTSAGLEVKLETVDVKGDRFAFDAYEVLAGPTVQWRPVPPMHLDLLALCGVEIEGDASTPLFEPTVVAGWEF